MSYGKLLQEHLFHKNKDILYQRQNVPLSECVN